MGHRIFETDDLDAVDRAFRAVLTNHRLVRVKYTERGR
jgi:hypothetical protein